MYTIRMASSILLSTFLILLTTQAFSAKDESDGTKSHMVDPESLVELYDKPNIPEHIDIVNVAEPSGLDMDVLGVDFLNPKETQPEPIDRTLEAPPPPPSKDPVVSQWHRTPLKKHKTMEKVNKSDVKPKSRVVKSFTVNGDEMSFNPGGTETAKRRVKRSHLGDGVPDDFEFTLEALDPYTDSPAGFKVGSVIPYRATIHASNVQKDIQIEIFSERNGAGFFVISNVRFGSIGGNFAGYSSANKPVYYRSSFGNGRHDYATLHMGTILNDLADASTESESQIEVLFEAQAVNHPDLVKDDEYRISVGALFDASTITVAQDDLIYEAGEPSIETSHLNSYSLTGPTTLQLGTTAVWTLSAALHDLYSEVTLDVLAPIYQPGALKIESINIGTVGQNFKYCGINDESFNISYLNYANYGDYARLDLGTILNAGYFDGDYVVESNTITFDVAVTMLDHTFNATHPYTLGFTLWSQGSDSVELMWSGQSAVQAEDGDLPELTTSPTFSVQPSADVLAPSGHVAVLVNISLPRFTSAECVVEISTPLFSDNAVLDINHMRVSKIGYNMPQLHGRVYDMTNTSTDSDYVDFMSMDLGIISNTGMRTDTSSNILQIEVGMTLLYDAYSANANGDPIDIAIGVKHATDYYWVGSVAVNVSDDPLAFSATQLPEFTISNIMGSDAYIYPETAAVLDLDIVIPPGVDIMPLNIHMTSFNDTHDVNTTLKFVDIQLLHAGRSLMYDLEGVELTGNPDEDPEVDGSIVNNSAELNFTYVTNLRDLDFPRYQYEESTLRIRATVIARSSAHAGMVDGQIYWIETTVTIADDYMYAGRNGIKYGVTTLNYYAVAEDWQPTVNMEVAENYAEEVGLGSLILYDVTFNLPYRTAASVGLYSDSTSGPVEVCRLDYTGHGSAILDYVTPTSNHGLYWDSNSRLTRTWNNHDAFTSYSYDNYGQSDKYDAYVNFTSVVMLDASATVGQSYTFTTVADLGGIDAITYTKTITVTDAVAEMTTRPEFVLKHLGGTDSINIGGHEIYMLDIYVPPGTNYKYEIDLLAPWNDTNYGMYEMKSAYLLSSGNDLPCFNGRLFTATVSSTDDNPTDDHNLATFSLGYVANVQRNTTEFIPSEANRIRVMFLVGIPLNTTALPGEEYPVAATVIMNDEVDTWVGYRDFTVLAENDESNVVMEYNRTMDGFHSLANETHLGIKADGDMTFTIGETQTYQAKLILPRGIALAQTRLVFESPLIDGEALITVSDLAVESAGFHMEHHLKENYYDIITEENEFRQQYYQQAYMGFMRNPDYVNMSRFINETDHDAPDVMWFIFSVRLLDNVLLADNYQFSMNASLVYNTDNATIAAQGNTTITVIAPATDTVVFDWEPYVLDVPSPVIQDSQLSFAIDLALSQDTKRFPDDLTVMFRVPNYSTLVPLSLNYSGLDEAFTAPDQVTASGLEFKWDRMRWDNDAHVNFSLIIDPTYFLEDGLLTKTIIIPVDMRYHLEDKTNPGTFAELYTVFTKLSFEIEVPVCTDYLGMLDDSIDDCQLSASSDDGTHSVDQSRLDSTTGWVSSDRGSPYFQTEYVQVDFGGMIKCTGLTLQPFNDVNVSRVTKFKIQHSREGIYWQTVVNSDQSDKEFEVSWPTTVYPNTTEFVPFTDYEFVTKKVRILPQENSESNYQTKMRFELNGCPWPHNASMPTYTCPSPSGGGSLKSYSERQWLAFDESVFVCMIPRLNELPYCSGSNDFGVSWFAIDDYVMNMLGYESSENGLYATARNRGNTLRSIDNGRSWQVVEESDFTTISNLNTYTAALDLPFPLDGGSVQQWYTNYGFTDGTDNTWSVSRSSVHAYDTDVNGLSGKSDTDNVVAQWGNTNWT